MVETTTKPKPKVMALNGFAALVTPIGVDHLQTILNLRVRATLNHIGIQI